MKALNCGTSYSFEGPLLLPDKLEAIEILIASKGCASINCTLADGTREHWRATSVEVKDGKTVFHVEPVAEGGDA
ncbi:MAG: hypothetical protein EOP06_00405 [Proteobacteria bacterium]|nr:MAG: hypothetical protein EOP06_00405 [Pseudomonadota bacterium]